MAGREPLRVGAVLSGADWWRRLNAHAADHGSDVEVVVVRDAARRVGVRAAGGVHR